MLNSRKTCPKLSRIDDPKIITQVRKRDGVCLWHHMMYGQCFGGLDVHHINTRGSGGGDILENMLTLCRGAHTQAHEGLITKQSLRAILSELYGYNYEENNG